MNEQQYIVVGSWWGDRRQAGDEPVPIRIEAVTEDVVSVSAWKIGDGTSMLGTYDLSRTEIQGYLDSGRWTFTASPSE